MMGVRKLLDFVFSENELKILDDILPEHKRKEKLEIAEEMDIEEDGPGGSIKYTESGVEVPLANGNVVKIPVIQDLPEINISEELNKSGVWKNVEANSSNPKLSTETEVKKEK
jgi:hypothetical protein